MYLRGDATSGPHQILRSAEVCAINMWFEVNVISHFKNINHQDVTLDIANIVLKNVIVFYRGSFQFGFYWT